jgi:riboflavin kinase/FMN adenylyltransferase
MNVAYEWPDLSTLEDVILALGVFDGVHLGHQSLIRGVVQRARTLERQSVVMTFHPHPRSVVAPESSWGYLCSLKKRIARIADLGPDLLIVLPFTSEFAATTAEDFVEELIRHVPLREVHVGGDFVFGQGGKGDVQLLRALGVRLDFSVKAVPPVCLDGQVISSTRIREMVQAGRVATASRWLGRPFCLQGQVIAGAGQGRQLGFPTANLDIDPRQILPQDGVYAVRGHLPPITGSSPLPGLAYIGRRPTFGAGERGVEVHLFDFDGDLLGHELETEFVQYLRADQAFDGPEALIDQMHRDADQARTILAR